jgi:anti-anti-sigma factor
MAGVDLSTRDCGGQVVVALRGQLDMAEAAGVAAALAAVAAREPEIIVDLAGLEFINSSDLAALVRGRNLARQGGSELLLAARQQQVRRQLKKRAGAAEALPRPRTAEPARRGQRQDRLVHPRPGRRRYRSRNTNTQEPARTCPDAGL